MSPQMATVLTKFKRWMFRYVTPSIHRYFHPSPSHELSIGRVFFVFVILVVVLNEYICFWWSFLRWPNLTKTMATPDDRHLRVLFVADPQIIGYRDGNYFFGPITRWDSDKYLQKSFSLAYGYARPDAVIFLGDLFDEGSRATDDEFKDYVDRFRKLFPLPRSVKVAFLPGDNDVGGEGRDRFSDEKQYRFESHFGKYIETVFTLKFVDFIPIRFNFVEIFDMTAHEILAQKLKNPVRVVLNHFTMLRCRASPQVINRAPVHVMNLFRSSVAFTGDIHKARHDAAFISPGDDSQQSAGRIETCHSTPLSATRNVTHFRSKPGVWHEVVTPTCNYRMGVSNMGFTVATFSDDGQVDVAFLWLPGRFGYLFLYLFLLIFLVVQYVYFKCGMGKDKLKPMPP